MDSSLSSLTTNDYLDAMGCLFVASKNNEIDPEVPLSSDYLSFLPKEILRQNCWGSYSRSGHQRGKAKQITDAEIRVM